MQFHFFDDDKYYMLRGKQPEEEENIHGRISKRSRRCSFFSAGLALGYTIQFFFQDTNTVTQTGIMSELECVALYLYICGKELAENRVL